MKSKISIKLPQQPLPAGQAQQQGVQAVQRPWQMGVVRFQGIQQPQPRAQPVAGGFDRFGVGQQPGAGAPLPRDRGNAQPLQVGPELEQDRLDRPAGGNQQQQPRPHGE